MKIMKKGVLFFVIGIVCFALALGLCCFNLYQNHHANQLSQKALAQLNQSVSSKLPGQVPDYQLHPEMDMPTVTVDGLDYIGVLSIPSRDLTLPIISEWSYPNLKKSPCRYHGSAYTNDFIVAAHNFSSHFGALKNLTVGETIVFTDVDGNEFTYHVVETETLQPTAVEEMKSGQWDLTLFTCTLGGSYRVTVRCELAQ